MCQYLTVICPGDTASERFALTLEHALKGRSARVVTRMDGPLENARVLFAVPLDKSGVNHGYYDLLAYLRTHPGCLADSVGGVLADGPGDLYTKAVGRELVLSASRAGCAFPGRPLVEATGDLRNFTVQAKNGGCSLEEAYRRAAADLASRLLDFAPPRHQRPKLLVLHASNRRTSNTLARAGSGWNLTATSRRSVCGTARWRTAPVVLTPCASTSVKKETASTAASWSRRYTLPSGRRTRWCSSAPTTMTPSPPI